MKFAGLVVFLGIALLTSSCATPVTNSDEAVDAARMALAKEGWTGEAVYEAQPTDDGWTVSAWRVSGYDSEGKPRFALGGHRIVHVHPSGGAMVGPPGR